MFFVSDFLPYFHLANNITKALQGKDEKWNAFGRGKRGDKWLIGGERRELVNLISLWLTVLLMGEGEERGEAGGGM